MSEKIDENLDNETLFQPATLAGFIKAVTPEDGKVDLLLAHNMRMPLLATTLFPGDMAPRTLRKLNKLELEINSWLLRTALRQLRQVHKYLERPQGFRKTWGGGITIREIEDLLLFFMFIAGELLPEQQRVVDAVRVATSNWREALR